MPMKFLIIRFSSIGDIVLTTPVVRCLKKQMPEAEIHYLTKESFRTIIETNPYIDKAFYLKDDLADIIHTLKQENYDHVVDLHHNLRTLKVKKALKRPSSSFNKLNIEKWLLTALKYNRMPQVHIVDRYMDTLKSFGITNDEAGLDYFIPDKDRISESDIPTSHLAGYVGVVIGAALNTKKLPVHKLQALCKGIDHPVVLLGGKEDRTDGDLIASVDPDKIYNACGRFKLNESADLVRRSKLIVSHDTGLMHIATALKKQVVSVWGNTTPDFGMYPYYGKNFLGNFRPNAGAGINSPFDIVEIQGLPCRPCSKIGYKKCPRGHFRCMEMIDINVLIATVHRRLSK
jgi:ADP-heptose:LPS heptosyltransferase